MIVSSVFGACFAYTQNTDVNFNIFSKKKNHFEADLSENLQTIKNLFAKKYVSAGFQIITLSLSLVPVAGASVLNIMRFLFEDESDWKKSFAEAVTDRIDRGDLLTTLKNIKSKIDTIQIYISTLNNTKISEDIRRVNVQLIHHDYQEAIYQIKNSKSLCKKYALITSPVLIALALSFATFYPTALSIFKDIVNEFKIPCQIYDLLYEYRPLAVDGRFEKNRLNTIIRKTYKSSI